MSSVFDNPNVPLALVLSFAAGFASVLGGIIACFMDPDNNKVMAGSLALAAGVMIFVSLVEIYPESTRLYHETGFSEDHAFIVTTGVYFAGTVMCQIADICTQLWMARRQRLSPEPVPAHDDHGLAVAAAALEELTTGQAPKTAEGDELAEVVTTGDSPSTVDSIPAIDSAAHKRQLMGTALFTAGAICLHNFPEGIVTFMATLHDPNMGLSLATAIAIHNIPEGIAVAAPVLKATGSKKQALFWTTISALAEPLGGVLAWLILGDILTDATFATMLALTAGIMGYIAIVKLQFTASQFDPTNVWAGNGFVLGNFVMALSLVLFRI